MKKYMIEEAKSGVTKGGIACGPVSGHAVASVKVNDGEKTEWWTIVEVDGIPAAFITDRDVFEEIIEDRFDDEFTNYMNEHAVNEFSGVKFMDDFNDFFVSFKEIPYNTAIPVIRLILTLLCSNEADSNELVEMARGKNADEIVVPISEYEMTYREDFDDNSEIRIYNPEENECAWMPKRYAEKKLNENGRDIYITVMAPPAEKWWNYMITDMSLIDFEEEGNEDWGLFEPHILERYGCVADLIEHRYLKEFLYVIAEAVGDFGIEANFTM